MPLDRHRTTECTYTDLSKMASAMLRGSQVLWWITPPAIGLTYHFSTVRAADNVNTKVDRKDLDIYDKIDKEQSIGKPAEDDSPSALEEQVSKARTFVWKHSETAKRTMDSTSKGFKKFVENAQEFARDMQTNRSLQLKTGAITVATLTGLVLAGKGRRPLRRVFFSGGLGIATAAVCYPNRTASTAKDAYHKLSALFQDNKGDDRPGASRVEYEERPADAFRTGETLLLEEAIVLTDLLVQELIKRVHVEDIHLPDFKTVCKEVVEEILLGISEDFEVKTGGFVGGKHVSVDDAHTPYDVLLRTQDITKRALQEVLDSIDEDMDIKTGGAHSWAPTIALDSTVLAKDLSARLTKILDEDLGSNDAGQQPYLFSDPDEMTTVISEEYVKCVEAAISAQVKTGRCHVILNSTSLAAKTGAELREAIENLKERRSADLASGRPVKISDSRVVSERVASQLLDFIEHHIKTSRGKDYAYSEAGHLVRKASEGATKVIGDEIQRLGAEVKGRKMRIALDINRLAKTITEEVTESIQEDIDIQTGSGFRGPSETAKPEAPDRKPSPPAKSDAPAFDGIMLSPMYVPGLEHLADAFATEVSEALHGRGVFVAELKHMAHVITREVLDAINEDIEIQTGGWSSRDHKAHVVIDAKDFIKKATKEVVDAIEQDMNIQTGEPMEKERDLFLDSIQLSTKIVDAVMLEVDRDLKKPGTSDGPFLFSLPQQLSELATKKLDENIENAAAAIGLDIRRIHVDVDSLADDVGRQLKDRIEAKYIRAKAMGELNSDREIALTDLDEIRKKVGATLKGMLNEDPLVTPRPGNEPVHVVEEFGSLRKRVVEEMTKAIREDIDVQAGEAKPGRRLSILIDATQLVKKVMEEIEEAVEENIDIHTGRGFQSEHKQEPEEKPVETPGNPGQSDPEDKDLYSTRSS